MMASSPGWFDAFGDNGGPTLYLNMNRTAAHEDVRSVLIYVTFTALFVAFLIVFPGIRKERISTFICVTISLFVGAVILVANFGTSWHVAQASISSPYRSFSREKIFADVGVNIGLLSVNITLKAKPIHKRNEEINYNERFYWIGPSEMKQEYQKALAKGLPYPILTIAEYLSQDGDGFCWGHSYRLAGYYSSVLLWAAFSTWVLMNVLLCAVPRYGAYAMQFTGVLMLTTNALYSLLLPSRSLIIPFEGGHLTFNYGWCFWSVLIAGVVAILVGATVAIIDTLFPNKFSTILEVDYDTPYRYFVGNDAHLVGPHAAVCPHQTASSTSSSATNSTCCGNVLKKTKSDVSTSTSSIPVRKLSVFNKVNVNNNHVKEMSPPEVTSTTITTQASIESHHDDGVTNEAFEGDNESDDSVISTTIIDGKRAVSLHNFGRFTAQQQREKESTFRNRNVGGQLPQRKSTGTTTTTSSSSIGTPSDSGQASGSLITKEPAPARRSSQIQLDLSSPAAMW